jgi:hypothetical protein
VGIGIARLVIELQDGGQKEIVYFTKKRSSSSEVSPTR